MAEPDAASGADTAVERKPVTGHLLGWVSTVDHKKIGILYICTAMFFLAVGGLEALLIRVQLLFPNNTLKMNPVLLKTIKQGPSTFVYISIPICLK